MSPKHTLLIVCLLCTLLIGALEKRLPGLTRPFWEDEVHHNYQILRATSLRDMRWSIQSQLQPFVDYALRKVLWFNLLGYQELGLRLPSLLASLATVASVFLLSIAYLRRTTRAILLPVVFALALGSWALAHPSDIHYAAEARHYSLVSLVSVLWVFVYLRAPRWSAPSLVVTSAVFMNVHFFSIPLVGAGLAVKALVGDEPRRFAAFIKASSLVAALTLTTALVNRPAFAWLLREPPGAATNVHRSIGAALTGGFDLFQDYFSYLALPVPVAVLVAVALGFALARIAARPAVELLVLVAAFLPALFFYFRLRSQYGFGPRYFTPFFGLGFGLLLVAAGSCQRILDRLAETRGSAFGRTVAIALAALALLACRVPAAAMSIVTEWPKLRRPPVNFSPYFQIYQELRASRRPLFVLHSHPWSDDIPLLYLQFVGGEPYPCGYQVADSTGTLTTPFDARKKLIEFVSVNPHGLVVLDTKEQACDMAGVTGHGADVVVERVRSVPACVWTIRGATSIDDVRAVAQAVNFEAAAGLL